ncbi:3-keto-disaccharide hydrolase [Crateriforma conspicua]|uniref:3-keto-disaccharide hydrolase n=1 Tax=Crateriforma conspicua TaxID=2527996 RepID=UPI0018C88AE7|nr:DUF1080 domain-containing protein [Crateriforma conspicua]
MNRTMWKQLEMVMGMQMIANRPASHRHVLLVVIVLFGVAIGCRRDTATVEKPAEDSAASQSDAEPTVYAPQAYEATADELLAACLTPEEASEGWIRLFDGHTLFGWDIAGNANWRIEDGTLVADQGEVSLLCTSIPWADYELSVQFKATPTTNSGVFLRTPLEVDDPGSDCYEVNIAPDDNPFPTASVVQRQKVDVQQKFDTWRTMNMVLRGDQLTVRLDGEVVCEYTDPEPLAAGRIGLQKNSGRIEFRDVKLRPLGLESMLGEGLDGWKTYPEMSGEFKRTDEGGLRVKGGKTQLETEKRFADFNLLAEYQMDEPTSNSGIFFRCIPGDELMGYECQVSNEIIDGNPLKPADCGVGGIFRRQDARIVAGKPKQKNVILLTTRGPRIAAWVNGLQVSDVTDDRDPDENPRRGLRLDPGTIMIQGHDETTDATYSQLKIKSLDTP